MPPSGGDWHHFCIPFLLRPLPLLASLGRMARSISSQKPMASAHDRQLDLLRIVCCVAWADGEVSGEERRLLEKLEARYFRAGEETGGSSVTSQLASWSQNGLKLEDLIDRLDSVEDRLLAVKLANMVARVSKRAEDTDLINPQEKALYRRLVEGLGLSESQIQEAEWAAEQELASGRNVWSLLGDALSGLGAWPSSEMLEKPGIQWL